MIAVACGVLVDAEGRVLIAQRPAGKVAAGKWEFPGGKIEPGESALQALTRELREELGVTVRQARRLIRFTHEYSDRKVILDTWRIDSYAGHPESREGQAFRWMKPSALTGLDVLPTVVPAVAALTLPEHYVFTPPDAAADCLLAGLADLPRGALLRLRQPALNDADYARLAGRLAAPCRKHGIGLMLDRDPAWSRNSMPPAGTSLKRGWEDWKHVSPVHADGSRFPSTARTRSRGPLARAPISRCLAQSVRRRRIPGWREIGWAGFERIIDISAMPVYAIGGLGSGQLHEAQSHGAQGIAGIRAYWSESTSSGDSGASVLSSGSA